MVLYYVGLNLNVEEFNEYVRGTLEEGADILSVTEKEFGRYKTMSVVVSGEHVEEQLEKALIEAQRVFDSRQGGIKLPSKFAFLEWSNGYKGIFEKVNE